MTTHPARIEPGRGRRAIAAALTAVVVLLVATYAAYGSIAIKTALAARPAALLGSLQSDPARALDRLTERTIHTAIAAMPLDQRIVNVAMARAARRQGGARAHEWLALLARLGWRDTPALQNMIYAAAQTGDLPRILDIDDALMRRQQLTEQAIQIIAVAEADPTLRQGLVDRLVVDPGWRWHYLTATGQLQDRSQLLSRYAFIRQLQRRGARLKDGEVIPSIFALDQGNVPEQGFALWRSIHPQTTRPLDDRRFAFASRSYESGQEPVPYQWRMMAGEGFSADASREGDRTALSINWDGRGVPLFAQQRSSAAPGVYALDVAVAPEDVADLPALAFRLVCDGTAIAFRQAGASPTHYVTVAPVPCSYPIFQLAGAIQPSAAAHQLSIGGLLMRPLAPDAR